MDQFMQFIDLSAQQKRIRGTIEKRIAAVLDHGKYIMGPEVQQLEAELAQFVGVTHAISCASGTDALLISLMAYGVGPGDAIITTPFTFIATAEVISLLGAIPVFVDIDKTTFNIDPEKMATVISAIKNSNFDLHPLPRQHEKTPLQLKGIIAVDLFGLPADYEKINAIAQREGLFVIEDAAQSLGGEFKGKKACSLAEVGCTSFFPAKPLGGYGDGGMCFTPNETIADVIRSLRIHGKGGHKYDNVRIGVNGRLDTLQASILLSKLEIFSEEIKLRQQVAQRYGELLGGHDSIIVPEIPDGYKSVWAQYSLLASGENHRQTLQDKLKDDGIPSAIYYPKPLHLQTAFAHLGYAEGSFPVCEDYSNRIFSLPMHPYLKEKDQALIAEHLK
jgi:dTDP-4-amino-4,6-dideoxygalactose transaminase